jgi:hypothetical protein
MYGVEEIGDDNSTIQTVHAIPALRATNLGGAPYRIAFMAAKVPPLGASVYKVSVGGVPRATEIKSLQSSTLRNRRTLPDRHEEPDVIASNEYYSVTFDG